MTLPTEDARPTGRHLRHPNGPLTLVFLNDLAGCVFWFHFFSFFFKLMVFAVLAIKCLV